MFKKIEIVVERFVNEKRYTVFHGTNDSFDDFDKQYGGYNFAYLLSDYKKHYKSYGDLKYGEEAVIFQGSGIRLFHYGDEEPQVIFWGSKAKNIIPITECGEEYPYCIESIKTGQILYENDFEEVVQWIVNNYNQYRKHLHI